MTEQLEIQPAFICPICGRIWPTAKLAQSCLDQGFERVDIKPGDIIQIGGNRFGWYDGDAAWVSPETSEERGMTLFALFYVVTAIMYPADIHIRWGKELIAWARGDYQSHRAQIHVETGSMSGDQGHGSGYTYSSGHLGYVKVDRPDLEALGRPMIGHVSRNLL